MTRSSPSQPHLLVRLRSARLLPLATRSSLPRWLHSIREAQRRRVEARERKALEALRAWMEAHARATGMTQPVCRLFDAAPRNLEFLEAHLGEMRYWRAYFGTKHDVALQERAYSLLRRTMESAAPELRRAVHVDYVGWLLDFMRALFMLDFFSVADARQMVSTDYFQLDLHGMDSVMTTNYQCYEHPFSSSKRGYLLMCLGLPPLRLLCRSAMMEELAPPRFREAIRTYVPRSSLPARRQERTAYVLVPEGGAMINTRSCGPIVSRLRREGAPVVVVSNNPATLTYFQEMGVETQQLPAYPALRDLWTSHRAALKAERALRDLLASLSREDPGFHGCQRHLGLFHARSMAAEAHGRFFTALFARRPPGVMLTPAEAHPSAVVAQEALRRHGAPWVGWGHVMYLPNTEHRHFPADHHLFYGRHGLDFYRSLGNPGHMAAITGTPLFDSALFRDAALDAATVRALLPDWRGEPYVVVGTEHRFNQMAEIVPTMRALARFPGLRVVLKLHPADTPSEFEALVGECRALGGVVDLVERCDLDALLHRAALLVTTHSNIIINAAMLGTPSIVHDYSDIYRVDFHAAGVSLLAESPEALERQTRELLASPERREACSRAARSNISQFCGALDGESAARVAAILLDLLAGRPFQEAARHGLPHDPEHAA